jgi:hypothetical protein
MSAKNTLKFVGAPFEKEPIKDTNKIWAFTLGDLNGEGWLSEQVQSFELLLRMIDSKKEITKKLLIAMPTYGNTINNFHLEKKPKDPPIKKERLVIAAFDGEHILKQTITFFDITVTNNTPHTKGVDKAGFRIIEIHVGGTIDTGSNGKKN